MNDKLPNFSIVIPVRNGEKYIADAIESVLNQTYQQFNILILENGSQDRTVSIVESFAEPRISIVPVDSPLSIEDNWGRIVEMELLEYLTLMGHDDLLYPDFLQEMVQLIQAEPGASLYHAHYSLIDSDGRLIRPCHPEPYRETGDEFLGNIHDSKESFCGTGYVMRSTDYKSVGGIPKLPGLLFADAICWYHLANRSYKATSPRVLYAFRVHDTSVTQTSNPVRFYSAGRLYLDSLSTTDYGRSPQNMAAARHFITVRFNRSYRRFTSALINRSDGRQMDEYERINQYLLARAADGGHLPSIIQFDLQTKLYQLIVKVPVPVLRKSLERALALVKMARVKIVINRHSRKAMTRFSQADAKDNVA